MIDIVLDANVALDWCLPTAEGALYSAPLAKLADAGKVRFIVPGHFHVEVSRLLVIKAMTIKKNPLGSKWLTAVSRMLDAEPIYALAMGLTFENLSNLAVAWNLDAPDVPYFHLARDSGLAIATRDKKIIAACKEWNVLHWTPTSPKPA